MFKKILCGMLSSLFIVGVTGCTAQPKTNITAKDVKYQESQKLYESVDGEYHQYTDLQQGANKGELKVVKGEKIKHHFVTKTVNGVTFKYCDVCFYSATNKKPCGDGKQICVFNENADYYRTYYKAQKGQDYSDEIHQPVLLEKTNQTRYKAIYGCLKCGKVFGLEEIHDEKTCTNEACPFRYDRLNDTGYSRVCAYSNTEDAKLAHKHTFARTGDAYNYSFKEPDVVDSRDDFPLCLKQCSDCDYVITKENGKNLRHQFDTVAVNWNKTKNDSNGLVDVEDKTHILYTCRCSTCGYTFRLALTEKKLTKDEINTLLKKYNIENLDVIDYTSSDK